MFCPMDTMERFQINSALKNVAVPALLEVWLLLLLC